VIPAQGRILLAWHHVAARKGYGNHPDGTAFALGGVKVTQKGHSAHSRTLEPATGVKGEEKPSQRPYSIRVILRAIVQRLGRVDR
jgi:hypothetical protein